jgi:putative membrane protein insertion efficiency factor
MSRSFIILRKLLGLPILLPVYFYRLFLSPLLPPTCRFQPTCSEYALDAVRQHGPISGCVLFLRRISHCHPIESLGAGHGFDPVPVEILCGPWYAPWRLVIVTQKTEDAHDYTNPA